MTDPTVSTIESDIRDLFARLLADQRATAPEVKPPTMSAPSAPAAVPSVAIAPDLPKSSTVPPCITSGKFAEALPKLWPHGNSVVPGLLDGMIASAPVAFSKWGISADIVVAHVMGEFGEECGCGTEMAENMNYSAARLLEVFPTHFNHDQAIALQHQPRRIADQAYNGRMGNRPGTDDGWDRRGQGLSQLTGLDEYIAFAKKTGIDVVNHPELLCDKAYALECGIADFVMCGCVPYALRDSVLSVASMLNVGHLVSDPQKVNGYAMRVNGTALWKHALGIG
jgi:putative chitinase